MTLLLIVIVVALAFEFINGFHDTVNSIATVVSTKVLTPRQAIVLAASTNLLGALWGTAVAKTIASGLVEQNIVSSEVLVAALCGGIAWNLFTWRLGLPSSSSHALIGGLCGAALAASHNDLAVIIWSQPSSTHWWEGKGLLWKVVIPMVLSPLLGFVVACFLMFTLYALLKKSRPRIVNAIFAKVQIFSAASMGFMHGTNDAQKTMGIIALAIAAATSAGDFVGMPEWVQYFSVAPPAAGKSIDIDLWIKVTCALTMAAGTAMGGWRIIRTLGHKMVKLQPIHGFAAETAASGVLLTATHFGIPVSTTHTITAAVMGVGTAKSLNAIKWTVVERIVWAWIFTLPCAALIAYAVMEII